MSWEYGPLATEVYELDKPVGRPFPGLDYYARQLAVMTGRILEPACGTGRVLIPLLEASLTVEGLDSSPQMLALCRQHCTDRNRRLPGRAPARAPRPRLDLPRGRLMLEAFRQ